MWASLRSHCSHFRHHAVTHIPTYPHTHTHTGGAAGGAAGAGLTTPSPSKFGRSGFVPFAGEGRRLDDSGGGGAGGGAGAGDGAAASPVSGVMAAMAEARARRAASSGGGTVLSPARRVGSAVSCWVIEVCADSCTGVSDWCLVCSQQAHNDHEH